MSETHSVTPSGETLRSSTSGQTAREAITAANARLCEALRARDADAIAACYTPDAQMLPANSDFVSGTAAITALWRTILDMGITDARLESAEVESLGDTAVEVGRYTLRVADGAAADEGKYVVVWHRHAGAWKLHRDIWTTNRPAPA